jgi:p-cumate 2,3-dioxygenase subunit beta
MAKANTSRQEVEDFLFQEADCLDRWALDDWLSLWAESGELSYQVAPTGEDDAASLDPASTMFLIADDRFRLEQRIVRMKKNSFHAEYIRSRTRHMYGHVRITGQDANGLEATFNAAVFRTKRGQTVVYPSLVRIRMAKTGAGLKLKSKRIELDLDYLANMGALTIIL